MSISTKGFQLDQDNAFDTPHGESVVSAEPVAHRTNIIRSTFAERFLVENFIGAEGRGRIYRRLGGQ